MTLNPDNAWGYACVGLSLPVGINISVNNDNINMTRQDFLDKAHALGLAKFVDYSELCQLPPPKEGESLWYLLSASSVSTAKYLRELLDDLD